MTVLGIVFFFVLAVNRGWINAELRVGFGAAASVAVFSAGFWLHRRFGTTHAALAAVGAGIAGAYATLLAAAAFYDFVPDVWALVAAAGIAAAATVVAIAWSAELVAGLGLVGALLVPLMTLAETGELTVVGTGFVAIVYAATATVAFRAALAVPPRRRPGRLLPPGRDPRRPERGDRLGGRGAHGRLLGAPRRDRGRPPGS